MVEPAIGIVGDKPERQLLPVGAWAIDVINEHSEAKLPDDAKKALMRFPVAATGRADGQANVEANSG